ncbi:MAG: hypothetical protein V3T72_06340 [Thermoanaerobaculia bacterium]
MQQLEENVLDDVFRDRRIPAHAADVTEEWALVSLDKLIECLRVASAYPADEV